ncbi:MAG TPA: hypothetical protein VFQ30_15670 [Ktedonobacteraceae bacterium]|nr:hypothetical protein [Ktedonobacteraceae bacterium]
MLPCFDHLAIRHSFDFWRVQLLERQLRGCHLALKLFFIDVPLLVELDRAGFFQLEALFLPLHGFRGHPGGEGLGHHVAADDLAPVLRQFQALEQIAKLLVDQVDAHHQVAAGRTGKAARFGGIAVVLPPVVGRIARIAAQLQAAVDTGDIARELVHVLDLLGTSAGVVHGLGHGADLLPLIIRECRRVQPLEALLFVLDGSPVIAWGIRRIKLVAQHGSHCVLVEEPSAKALTAGAIACLIQRISDFIGLHPLHAQLAKQTQAGVLFGVKLRRCFRTGRTIPEGNIAVIEPLRHAFAFPFASVLG